MLKLSREKIRQMLQDHGLKGSAQRIGIYEYLLGQKSHPTVDQIYQALSPEMPTLSKTTVYNTLRQLTEVGMVSTLTIEENENRYDADLSDHGHFKCLRCGKVEDIALSHDGICSGILEGYEVMHCHVYFRGYCHACASTVSGNSSKAHS